VSVAKGPRDLPQNRREMVRTGYKFLNHGACKSCEAPIEWWLTSKGKKMPFNPAPAGADDVYGAEAIVHFDTCTARNTPSAPATELAKLGRLGVEGEIDRMRGRHNARAMFVLLDCDGYAFSIRNTEQSEDLLSCIIEVANAARDFLKAKEQEASRG